MQSVGRRCRARASWRGRRGTRGPGRRPPACRIRSDPKTIEKRKSLVALSPISISLRLCTRSPPAPSPFFSPVCVLSPFFVSRLCAWPVPSPALCASGEYERDRLYLTLFFHLFSRDITFFGVRLWWIFGCSFFGQTILVPSEFPSITFAGA